MNHETPFDRLHAKDVISPIGPTPDPHKDNQGPNRDNNAYCKYHRGNGHKADDYYRLNELIQDMIDDGRLTVPTTAKIPKTYDLLSCDVKV